MLIVKFGFLFGENDCDKLKGVNGNIKGTNIGHLKRTIISTLSHISGILCRTERGSGEKWWDGQCIVIYTNLEP